MITQSSNISTYACYTYYLHDIIVKKYPIVTLYTSFTYVKVHVVESNRLQNVHKTSTLMSKCLQLFGTHCLLL